MKRNLIGLLCFGIVTALLVSGCATTSITSSWKDPAYQKQPHKIMIIGITKKAILRRVFEDEFARQFETRGTSAVVSYTVLSDMKQADHASIAAKMKALGADALLIARMTSRKTVQVFVPGSYTVVPPYYGNWRDYYAYGSQVIYTPGYTAEEELALVETNLYDAVNDKLIWSATSETEVLGSNQNQIESYIGVMVDDLVDKKLLR